MTAGPDRVDPFYAVVRGAARFWLWFFWKRVDVRAPERVPASGPVLLCINHPNNLIDSLIVGAVLTRKVHYLATASLFRNPLVARFLRACGAVPVYRKQDDPTPSGDRARTDKNADAFSACFSLLERGRVIGIYPEGTTHAEARVQRIKTGAARLALSYEARRPATGGAPLAVVPVGLTFEARKAFRGHVRLSFGEPVSIGGYLAVYGEDPVKAVDALTTEIHWAMEAEIVHVDRLDRAGLVRALEELYRDDLVRELQAERGLGARQIDPFRLSQSIADAVAHFADRDPARVERMARQVDAYRALLAACGVGDPAVRTRLDDRARAAERIRHSGQATAGLPLFAYGAVVNFLPYYVPRVIARWVADKETSYATTRLLAAMVAFPLFWGLETWIVWRLAGPLWAAAFAVSLPLSGLLAYRYLGGLGRLRRRIRFGVLALTRRADASRLLAARREIVAELDRAKADYLTATRGSTY